MTVHFEVKSTERQLKERSLKIEEMFYSISDQSSLGLVYAIGHCRSRLQCKSLQVFGVTWPCCLRFGLRKISSAFMGRGIELDMSIYVIYDMLGGFWEKSKL